MAKVIKWLKLKEKNIKVTIDKNDFNFFVWSENLNIWGEGHSEEEAIKNFSKNAEELYCDLEKESEHLGPALRKIWEFFQN